VEPLAAEIKASLLPMFKNVDLIVPMPASTTRARQPVDEIAKELSRIADILVPIEQFEGVLPDSELHVGAHAERVLAQTANQRQVIQQSA
jgi:hypothetical protein